MLRIIDWVDFPGELRFIEVIIHFPNKIDYVLVYVFLYNSVNYIKYRLDIIKYIIKSKL